MPLPLGWLRTIGLAGALLIAASAAAAQTADELFDGSTLQEIRLFINSRDLTRLRENYQENTYYTADLLWRGVRVRNIALRSRGGGSRNPIKPGLRLDFDRYVTGQRFVGLTSLVLDNEWQDPAMIRERLAMRLFERLGEPAPRESYCRLFINNEYQGLYAIVEETNGDFATRTLGETGGYVFEYHYIDPFYGEYLGADLAAYVPLFEPRTHVLESNAALYGPIERMLWEVNQEEDAVWRDRVEQYLDLAQFVRHAAIENFVADNDGILGYAGMNNFYLYRSAGSTRHRLFPWDKDNAFLFIDSSVLLRADDNAVFRRAFAYPDLRELFLQTIERCARTATEEDWLSSEIEAQVSLISASVREDRRKQFSNDEFDQAIEFLREFARARPSLALEEVNRIRHAIANP